LTVDIDSFSKTIEELTSANNALDAEVSDLMRRVASGEYNPSTERCIEFKNNPAAKATAVRTEALERLKSENDALLERLAVVDKTPVTVVGQGASGSNKDGLVPRESFERVVRDKEEMERAHAKRLLRLKEVSRGSPFT
jgi:mitotic spindle assembly checkpoint protein MAD1